MAMMLDQKAQINMTPMIDILLVLIIIFMVITPLTPTVAHACATAGPASRWSGSRRTISSSRCDRMGLSG